VAKLQLCWLLRFSSTGKKLTDRTDYFRKDTNTPVLIELAFHEFGDKFDGYGLTGCETVVVRRTFEFNEKPVTEIQVDGDWQTVKPKFNDILPDFVLVPADRNLESQGKMTTTSLFGKLFRPLVRQVVEAEGAESANELREKIRFAESFTRCASPPESVVDGWPNVI
jgi:hypothetical protein